MPIPNTTDVGELIRFFRKDRPNDSAKQRLAIALSVARKNGANIKEPKKKEGEEKKAMWEKAADNMLRVL